MNIKELRIKKGFSQQELADKLGVHVNTIKNWEAGKSTISPKKEHLLLKIFGQSDKMLIVTEPKNIYKSELTGDIIEDLRELIYQLKETIKDKEEIIELLKKQLNKNNDSSKVS